MAPPCVSPQPIAVDLFAGLGGWTEGLLAEGYYVVGFDIERHEYGDEKYPAQLVLQDVRTIHGRQFKNASLIVGSSPCQEFSYRAMPWTRAKALGPPILGMELFEAQFRIQREACEAAGRHIPMVVENVRGAQKWVGRSRWNFGSFHLWGDVPALMPTVKRAVKVGGLDWNRFKKGDPNYKGEAFNTITRTRELAARDDIKNTGGSWFGVAHNKSSGVGRNPCRNDPRYAPVDNQSAACFSAQETSLQPVFSDGIKQGGDWFNASQPSISRKHSSKSIGRKRASAMIAKIPLALARHIARVYHPDN